MKEYDFMPFHGSLGRVFYVRDETYYKGIRRMGAYMEERKPQHTELAPSDFDVHHPVNRILIGEHSRGLMETRPRRRLAPRNWRIL